MKRALTLLLAALLLAPLARAADETLPPALFALIIGSNQSPKPELPTLRHADDDAAKYFELFSQLGEARLLTVLDDESQRLFGSLADRSIVPSRGNLKVALDELLAGVAAARQQGRRSALYFIYSGHGDVGAGMQGLLYLGNETFSRRDLYQQVIGRSQADYNHVVIDACNAYFMVERRGDYKPDEASADHAGLVQDLLAAEELRSHPNTGVVLSTSAEADSHEWSKFGGGVFSHEVRSGLLGAADLDLDGRVSYDELAAYLAAANSKVDNPTAKIHYYAEAPAKNRREPVLTLRSATGPASGALLQLERSEHGRFYVEDGRGLRYADFHKADDGALLLWLLPGPRYFARSSEYEVEIAAASASPVELAALERKPLSAATIGQRGAIDDALRAGLYAVPFSRSFLDGYAEQAEKARVAAANSARAALARPALRSDAPHPGPERVWWRTALPIAGWSLAGLGGASAIAGGVLVKLGLDDNTRFNAATTLDRKLALRDAIYLESQAATVLFVVAGAVAATGGALLIGDLALGDDGADN